MNAKAANWNLIALALLVVVALTAPARAQSDAELRREITRLRTENADLTRDLDAANQKIADLERAVEELRKRMAEGRTGGGTPEPEPEKVSIDETERDASPRAMLEALKTGYQEAMGDSELGENDSRERTLYMNSLERWMQQVARDYRMNVEWTLVIKEISPHPNGKDWAVAFQAVDPVHSTALGDSFVGLLSNSRRRNLERGVQGKWLVRGRVTPGLRFNPHRRELGTFDSPRFVGPFVEFGFEFEVLSIIEAKAGASAG